MTNSVFQGRSFLAEKDFTRAELEYLIGLSAHLKDLKKRNIEHHYLAGKNIALLFEKTSTRTRAAFTTAAIDLGAHPEYLGANDIQLGKKNLQKILLKFLDVCLMVLNSVVSANVWLKNWLNSQVFQYGMV